MIDLSHFRKPLGHSGICIRKKSFLTSSPHSCSIGPHWYWHIYRDPPHRSSYLHSMKKYIWVGFEHRVSRDKVLFWSDVIIWNSVVNYFWITFEPWSQMFQKIIQNWISDNHKNELCRVKHSDQIWIKYSFSCCARCPLTYQWFCGIHYHKLLVDDVRALSTASGLYWLLLRGSPFTSWLLHDNFVVAYVYYFVSCHYSVFFIRCFFILCFFHIIIYLQLFALHLVSMVLAHHLVCVLVMLDGLVVPAV